MTEARARISELVNRVGFGKERIILSRHGKPLVALIPAEELDDSPTPTSMPFATSSSQTSERRPNYLDVAARASNLPPGPLHRQ